MPSKEVSLASVATVPEEEDDDAETLVPSQTVLRGIPAVKLAANRVKDGKHPELRQTPTEKLFTERWAVKGYPAAVRGTGVLQIAAIFPRRVTKPQTSEILPSNKFKWGSNSRHDVA